MAPSAAARLVSHAQWSRTTKIIKDMSVKVTTPSVFKVGECMRLGLLWMPPAPIID